LRHSNAYNSKPEVEIDFIPTAFITLDTGLKTPLFALLSLRQVAPQVPEIEKVPRPQKFQTPFTPNFAEGPIPKNSKGVPTFCRSANLQKNLLEEKISGSKKVKFRLGDPDPQMWRLSLNRVGALCVHPEGAHNGERTVSISAAVTEKIAFEENLWRLLAAEPKGCGVPCRV